MSIHALIDELCLNHREIIRLLIRLMKTYNLGRGGLSYVFIMPSVKLYIEEYYFSNHLLG